MGATAVPRQARPVSAGGHADALHLLCARVRDPVSESLDTRHADTRLPCLCLRSVFREGRWHTLLTSAFSHAHGWHLAFNMFALSSIAPPLSQIFGENTFLAVSSLACGLVSAACNSADVTCLWFV